ncbi:GtrA family protein [Pseudorhodoferax sp. LjRoot39]|uniref:GtrA family protein n=1 Tax=Pseudorhodoferax sp. LjRoot39 TaxID=3342328 RepID=UPI003ED16ADC
MQRFGLFCIAGGLAFLVDAGVLYALTTWAGAGPYCARLVSFLCAVSTTWLFNRSITFADTRAESSRWLEWGRYLVSQLGGFAANYFVYAALVWRMDIVGRWPVLGVAAGSLAGLVLNYVSARRYVFGRK